jgi:hypothetical protein
MEKVPSEWKKGGSFWQKSLPFFHSGKPAQDFRVPYFHSGMPAWGFREPYFRSGKPARDFREP